MKIGATVLGLFHADRRGEASDRQTFATSSRTHAGTVYITEITNMKKQAPQRNEFFFKKYIPTSWPTAVRFPTGADMFLFVTASRPAVRSTQPTTELLFGFKATEA
jgi:hypothetical protein